MNTLKNINIQELSKPEWIVLAEKLWDSIEKEQDDLEVTHSQKKVLEQRFAAYQQTSADDLKSWEEVKNEMINVDRF
ncbi:MAG: addiction module protein [Gammaproteobacteria bacterium]|nr:addiction module protein [Gammaproteobacteria bacterium]